MKIIAHINSDFSEKFGIPRQSGLVEALRARVVMEPEFRCAAAFQGLEDYSHIWLLWQFSENLRSAWSPTVRPPRLGGNRRMGVFATRSPFRPNPIGLSCVRLERIAWNGEQGPVLYVAGADLLNQTPIYDIKPYLPHVDSRPDARGGFAAAAAGYELQVEFPEEWLKEVPADKQEAVIGILKQDPRPAYQNDPQRIYGVTYGGRNIRFWVRDGVLTVCGVEAAV